VFSHYTLIYELGHTNNIINRRNSNSICGGNDADGPPSEGWKVNLSIENTLATSSKYLLHLDLK
jgi:hypothetical protein